MHGSAFFGPVLVMCVYAPDSAKEFEEYEKFMGEMKKIWHGGRRTGAQSSHVAGDVNMDFGLLFTGDGDAKGAPRSVRATMLAWN